MKYKTAFRLALRAIAILVIAQSLPWCIIALAKLALTILTDGWIGPSASTWEWETRMTLVYFTELLLGLYLLFGGNWIVNRVIPSNRPYCHECAYELSGLPAEGNCPECGTPYRRTV